MGRTYWNAFPTNYIIALEYKYLNYIIIYFKSTFYVKIWPQLILPFTSSGVDKLSMNTRANTVERTAGLIQNFGIQNYGMRLYNLNEIHVIITENTVFLSMKVDKKY